MMIQQAAANTDITFTSLPGGYVIWEGECRGVGVQKSPSGVQEQSPCIGYPECQPEAGDLLYITAQ